MTDIPPRTQINPFAGPAFFMSLKNALEHPNHPAFYQNAPRTGGTQVSLRLDARLLAHIDAIMALTEWNRAEVVYSLIERGLFDLFELADRQKLDSVIACAQQFLCPPHPPVKHPEGNKQK